MATALGDLIVNFSANSASFQSEIAKATRLSTDYHKAVELGSRRVESASLQSQRALASVNSQLVSVRSSALAMAGTFAGAFATSNLISLADQWTQINARLKLASQSTLDFSRNQAALMEISQRTGTAFTDNANLFARSAASMREFGYSSKDVLKVTEAVSTGLKLSGASVAETNSVITQLSQAFSSGVLRGQEFNSVNENGDRVIRALAAGMGIARKDMKAMADQGLLTSDKVIPALISQLGTLQQEYASMPGVVSRSAVKVQNALMQWVGSENESSGATAALSSALDGLAGNIDNVATGLGILVAIGTARYFGNMAIGLGTATGGLLSAQRAEVVLAAAQVEGAKTATAAARATLYRAQQARAAAVGIEAQIAAERQLAVAQNQLSASIVARTAAQNGLNTITSLGARLGGGLLRVVGGLPGLIIGAAMSWGYVSLQNEQAHKVALAYSDTVDKVRLQLSGMSINSLQLTAIDAGRSMEVQREEITKTKEEVRKLEDSLKAMKSIEASAAESPWMTKINTFYSLSEAQEKVVEIQGDLIRKNAELEEKTEKLRKTEELRKDSLNESINKTAQLAGAVGSLAGMYEQLNRVTNLATASASAAFSGLQLPKLDAKQQEAITRAQREQRLAGLKGVEKVRLQATFEADDLKLPPGRYEQYIAAKVGAEQKTEALTAATKAQQKAEQDAASAAKKSATVAGEHQQKIANLNKEIQVEAVRLKEGDAAAALFSASLEAGTKWTEAQRKELIQMNKALAEAKQRWEDHNAAIANDPYRQAAETKNKANEQLKRQIADGEIKSAEEIVRRKQDINTAYLQSKAEADQRYAVSGTAELAGNVDPIQNLENQLAKRHALIESYANAGVLSQQRANQLIVASDREAQEQRYQASLQLYASQGDLQKTAVDLFQTSQERLGNMLTGMLTKTQTLKEGVTNLFASLTQSIIQNLIDMASQALVTSAIMKTITGIAGGIAGGAAAGASGAASAVSSSGVGAMGMSTSFAAYDSGGFTGIGGKYDPAGIVHKGEFVFDAESTRRIGVDNLYGMMRGYATGGFVSAANDPFISVSQDRKQGYSGSVSVMPQVNVYVDLQQKSSAAQGNREQLANQSLITSNVVQMMTEKLRLSSGLVNGRGNILPFVSPTRPADRSIDIKPTTASQSSAIREGASSDAPVINITINSNGQSTVSTPPGLEQFGNELAQFVDQRYRALREKDLGQSGAITKAIQGRR